MTDAGSAMMGIGEGTGEHRAADAAQKAIASPLLETTIEGARGVIFNITGGPDMAMYEVNEAAEMISRAVDSGRADHLRRVDRSDDDRQSARHRAGRRLRRPARDNRTPATRSKPARSIRSHR